jgi:hypothetical protein
MLHEWGLLGPRATLTTFGFKTAMNITKYSAAMANVKKLATSLILAPVLFAVRADGPHQQLTDLFAPRAQSDVRGRYPSLAPAP